MPHDVSPEVVPFTEDDAVDFVFFFLEDDEATPENITGLTIKLHLDRSEVGVTDLVKTAVIVDGPGGEAKVSFVTGDLLQGIQPAQFEITNLVPETFRTDISALVFHVTRKI